MYMAESQEQRHAPPVTSLVQRQTQDCGEAGNDVPPIVGDMLVSPG